MENTETLIAIQSYREKIMGCWLGKAVGGTLGMPYEGCRGPLGLKFYDPVPEAMLPNDDLDLQVVWACLLDEQAKPVVGPDLFIEAWTKYIEFPWDEYGVCKRNLAEGILPPLSGSFDNWFKNGMGAVIRSEIWACLAPGNPALAAAYACEDACLDHSDDGLWAEVWLAALQSAAFVENDIQTVIEVGFEFIPPGSIIHSAIADTEAWWRKRNDWRWVRSKILQKYGHENFTNVIENLAFAFLALLDGDGDFSRSICTAVNCGKDTDCTGATVGALLGILNPESIGEEWLRPIGRDLVLSPGIVGLRPPPTLDAFADLVVSLRERLEGRAPVKAVAEMPKLPSVPARVGSMDVSWFTQGWQFSQAMELRLPKMEATAFQGTWSRYDVAEILGNAFVVEYAFELPQACALRLMFNTGENCRVFLNGAYAFGREMGRMSPSPHRVPLNQAIDVELSAGLHRVVAVIEKPESATEIDWVIGLSDARTYQWLPRLWRKPT